VRLIVFNYAEEDEDGLVLYSKRGIGAIAHKFLDSLMSWRASDEEVNDINGNEMDVEL
jgi:hypothetical protein